MADREPISGASRVAAIIKDADFVSDEIVPPHSKPGRLYRADNSGATSAAEVLRDILEVLTPFFFRAPDGVTYVDQSEEGRAPLPLRSAQFKHLLVRRYYDVKRLQPPPQAVKGAVTLAEALANAGPIRPVYVRVAEHNSKFYLDLCRLDGLVVEIDEDGWRVITSPPVMLLRHPGMLPLPVPLQHGSIEDLRPFLNLETEDDFVLIVSWLLAALRPMNQYPLLVFVGEQGSAKTSGARMLRSTVDPNCADLRSCPSTERDLMIAARNAHVLAFDNVSSLSGWLPDALCRLATGGGSSTRRLLSDSDETLFFATKPVMFNGIEQVVTQADLMARAILIMFKRMEAGVRVSTRELKARFDEKLPGILGALLNAMSVGLRQLPHVQLANAPRLVDFAEWATACEPAFAAQGAFMAAYERNAEEAGHEALDADMLACCVREFMREKPQWRGTATELLRQLTGLLNRTGVRPQNWPSAPNRLSQNLRRSTPLLRQVDIVVSQGREAGGERTRFIEILNGNPSSDRPERPRPGASTPHFQPDHGVDAKRQGDGRDDRDGATDFNLSSNWIVN